MADAPKEETKKAAINGLAVVGFGALIIGGIFLAIYAARYVPETLSRLSGAVILSTDEEPQVEEPVVPVTESEEEEPRTGGPLYVPAPVPEPAPAPTNPPVYYTPPQVISTQPQLYGRADLALTNARVGYFRGSSFVEDNEVPDNRDAGVKFTVRNNGTNVASGWRVRVDVEGEDEVTGSGGQLMPGGTQNFTLRIENPEEGENIRIEIDVDYRDSVDESNERNNDRTLDIDIDN
ncbi:hypothetical protein L0Y34_01505 [Candidatus Parcubacteria bacterium]|nr:hypothetical protein [Candidatus Parcubacteria bacterium]